MRLTEKQKKLRKAVRMFLAEKLSARQAAKLAGVCHTTILYHAGHKERMMKRCIAGRRKKKVVK